MGRTFFATLLIGYMLLSSISFSATYGGGSGTTADPYQIWTAEQMNTIGANSGDWGKSFVLMADIDMSAYTGTQYKIIGNSSTNFTGKFDGNSHKINNLTIDAPTQNFVGLFGCIDSSGQVNNLGLENINIIGQSNVGGLAGHTYYQVAIASCYSTGSVSGIENVGGLVGYNNYYSDITSCYSACSVSGIENVGGLAGESDGDLYTCYSVGSVSGSSDSQYVGGLLGYTVNGTITYCYSSGSVSGSSYVGGLVGYNVSGIFNSCYSVGSVSGSSYVGGLAGSNDSGDIIASFWDIQTSGQTTSASGVGKTTLQMKDMFTYSSNKWGSSWTLDPGNDYPRLAWEKAIGTAITAPTVTMVGSGTASSPWIIASKDDFLQVCAGLFFWNKYYRLDTDIDLSGAVYPLGLIGYDESNNFTGVFDGNGHTISNLTINTQTRDYAGLFGYLSGQVKNLGLENANITGRSYVGGLAGYKYGNTLTSCYSSGSVSGSSYVGGLVGYNYGGTLTSCYTSGSVDGSDSVGGLAGYSYGALTSCYSASDVSGLEIVGGLVGYKDSLTVTSCYSTGNVTGSDTVGGLVGYQSQGTIATCYCTGNVTGSDTVGGLAGSNGGTLTSCYSVGSVSGFDSVGGLVGGNGGTITSCYSAGSVTGPSDSLYIGGLVGKINYSGTVAASFWDIQSSGQITSGGGFGKTTLQMKDMFTFSSSNWGSSWTIDSGNDYPHLAWENAVGTVIIAPTVALAGSGTAVDPWIIASKDDFLLVCSGVFFWNKYYRLDTDIDLSGADYPLSLIGYDASSSFAGGFDGNGHTISNLTIQAPTKDYVGLFGYIKSGSQVKNLGLENVNITGHSYVGGLAGYNYYGTLTSCYSTGSVSGYSNVGGLAGYNDYKSNLTTCYSSCNVNGSYYIGGLAGHTYYGALTSCYSIGSVSGSSYVGGLVGYNDYKSNLTTCYSSGSVSGSSGSQYVGGLTGMNDTGKITSCYSTGNVIGSSSVGGLAGQNRGTLTTCYSSGSVSGFPDSQYVGGLLGTNSGTVTASFWDIQTSGQTASAGGIGKTTSQMKNSLTYSSSNWGSQWTIDSGNDYPHLAWENAAGTVITTPTITMAGSGTAADPWIITSKEDFDQVCNGILFWNKYYRLDVDIDLSGETYLASPIGYDNNNSFTGGFDGNGHTISNLTLYAPTQDYAGLFGCISSGGQIKNLGLKNINITGRSYVGGLVGYNYGGPITCCYSSGSVSGSPSYAGGLVGNNSGTLTCCYSSGSVSGSADVGGLAGGSTGTLTACYSISSVSGSPDNQYVGGLVGANSGHVITSFWDIQTSGQTTSAGGVGKTTVQMKDRLTYSGNNWGSQWTIDSGNDYPHLAWENAVGTVITAPTITMAGSGTVVDPWIIASKEDFEQICSGVFFWNKYFRLDTDIDLSGATYLFSLIGYDKNSGFTGGFDGNGHTISNLTIHAPTKDYVGLFGYINSGGQIKNLGLENISITGRSYVGGLTGYNECGILTSCYSSGNISNSSNGQYVGGLVAYNYYGTLTSCYSTGSVTGQTGVGGLVGYNYYSSTLTSCYSAASVSGSWHVGGLVGMNDNSNITSCYSVGSITGYGNVGGLAGCNYGAITTCYSSGSVSGSSGSQYIGGLTGYNYSTLISCYSTGSVSGSSDSLYVGGLMGAGANSGTVTACFWDIQTSGQATSARGLGKTTLQMKDVFTYSSNKWGSQWTIDSGNDYPRLTWENAVGTVITAPTVTMAGSGTSGDPWIIASKDDFLQVCAGLFFWNKYYRLDTDIDLSGAAYPFSLIGYDINNSFTGGFDGNGHKVTNLTIDAPTKDYVGLFGYINSGGQIKNLGLENISITGRSYVGGLVGRKYGAIATCYSSGSVSGSSGSQYVGGLVGYNDYSGGTLTSCYSSCSVSSSSNSKYVGGLVGHNYGAITTSYSSGSVSGSSGSQYVGGLVGANSGAVITSFWDIQTSGQITSSGGTGLATAQMQTQSTFTSAGWDFSNTDGNPPVWYMNGIDYPVLTWQLPPVTVPYTVGMTQSDAQTVLITACFMVSITKTVSNSIPAGVVISQMPVAATMAGYGSWVNLTVSLGRPVVPNVAGMTQAAAQTAITAASLVTGSITQIYSDSVAAENVISQMPAAGTAVDIGSLVDLVVSLGKPVVPNVARMSQANAQSAIISASLSVGTVSTVYHNSIAAGIVISQSLAAGASVNIGTAVNLVVSLGKPVVPDITGKTQATAQAAITSAGLIVGTVTQAFNATIPAGNIVSQSPAAGTLVNIGSAVNMVVSIGPGIVVPDVTGLLQANAQYAITSVGLSAGTITAAYHQTIPAGYVISQSPAAGQSVVSGTTINLVVSLGKPYSGGSGTAADPYKIADANDLNAIGVNSTDWNKYFILIADIDMFAYTGTQYNIIGNETTPFAGTFEGNGHKIRNLTITTLQVQNVGLFGYTSAATIKNLGVENANISCSVASYSCAGALIGYQNNSTLINCYSTGSVRNLSKGSTFAGGLVGQLYYGDIANCYSLASANASCTAYYAYAGGLVGGTNATIANCYSMGSVHASAAASCSAHAGGLVGLLSLWEFGSITNCYSTGVVTTSGNGSKYQSGLVNGDGGYVVGSFWNTQTSGLTTSAGGTGKTTEQMQNKATFTSAGWNFDLWNAGKISNALSFDGMNDYVKVSGYGGIGGSNPRTVSMWIKTSVSSQVPTLIQWGSDATGQLWMLRIQANGTAIVAAYGGGVQSSRTVTDNQWHHIAAVLPAGQSNSSQILLYIDGQLDTVQLSSSCTINTTQTVPVHLGVWYRPVINTYSNCYSGLMDDVRIYNRALNASEILSVPSIGLVAHWTMDEFRGGIIHDTASSFHGVMKASVIISNLNTDYAIDSWYMNGYPHLNWEAVNPLQSRIDAASDGDTVTVQPGVYQGLLDFKGKNITLTSSNPQDSSVVASTIIRGLGVGPVVSFAGTETSACVLQGFTIENGNGSGIYGGAACSSATIRNCVIRNNNNACNGGGIANCSGLVANCILRNNTATSAGSALYQCNGQIVNCTIVSSSSSAISLVSNCSGSFINCILTGAGTVFDNCTGLITYSSYQGATGIGNIDVDPLFINAAAGDYHLLPDSPCNDAGDPASDYSNEPFPNGSRVDMGAYGNTLEATNSREGLVSLGFVTVNKTRVGRTSFEYELAVTVHNSNAFDMISVQVQLMEWDTAVQSVSDDSIIIDTIPAGATVTSTDTFKIIVDRSTLINSSRLTWELTYYTPGGQVQQAMMAMSLSALDAMDGDITGDGKVNLEDFAILAGQWNAIPGTPSADIALPLDNYVGIEDLMYFVENWLN